MALCLSRWLLFIEAKVLRDKEERYLLVKGHLGESLVTFLVYYAPNTNQVEFFHFLLQSLAPDFEGDVILAGDSNLALDHVFDKSHAVALGSPTKQSHKFAQLLYH